MALWFIRWWTWRRGATSSRKRVPQKPPTSHAYLAYKDGSKGEEPQASFHHEEINSSCWGRVLPCGIQYAGYLIWVCVCVLWEWIKKELLWLLLYDDSLSNAMFDDNSSYMLLSLLLLSFTNDCRSRMNRLIITFFRCFYLKEIDNTSHLLTHHRTNVGTCTTATITPETRISR